MQKLLVVSMLLLLAAALILFSTPTVRVVLGMVVVGAVAALLRNTDIQHRLWRR